MMTQAQEEQNEENTLFVVGGRTDRPSSSS